MFKKFIKEVFNEAELNGEGFIQKNKLFLHVPVGDFVKGYVFDKSDNHFYVSLFVQPSYIPSSHIFLSYGWRLKGNSRMGEMFFWEEDQILFTKAEVVRLIRESKNVIKDIKSPTDFYRKFGDLSTFDKFNSVDPFHHSETMAATLCYLGDPLAPTEIENAISFWHTSSRKGLNWMKDIHTRLLELRRVCGSEEDKSALFKTWKSYTINNLRLNNLAEIKD